MYRLHTLQEFVKQHKHGLSWTSAIERVPFSPHMYFELIAAYEHVVTFSTSSSFYAELAPEFLLHVICTFN